MTTPADPALSSSRIEGHARQLVAAFAAGDGRAYAGWDRADATAVLRRPARWPGEGHSTPGIGKAWLHLPTGAAGLIGVRPHHDHGPIADRSATLLAPVNPQPLPAGHPYAQHTAADVDIALRAYGWQVISRDQAATRLRAAGYRLGTNRAAGHLLYADDADATTWREDFTGFGLEAFAAPIRPSYPARTPRT